VLLNYAPESVASSPLPNQRDAVTSSADPLSSVSQTPVSIVSSFDGLSQIQDSCKCVPPDVQVATGPSHIVEMVNTQGEFFTKQGHSIQNLTLSLFFNTGSDFLSDPKVMYDASSGRWFASIIDIVGLNFVTLAYSSASVKVAVSLSSDPTVTNPSTSTWNIYTLQFGKTLPDQPILGVSDDKLVISTNDFASLTGGLLGAQYWVLNKNDMVKGVTSAGNSTFGPFAGLISVHPVQSLSSTSTEYMVSTGCCSTSRNFVGLFNITGTPGVSKVTVSSGLNLTISLIGTFPNGPGGCGAFTCGPQSSVLPDGLEPGNFTLDTGDIRVQDAAWFQGKIWLGLNDACTPAGDTQIRSCYRLTEISTASAPQRVLQDFDVGAKGQYYFYPALRFDRFGDLDVLYGFSSSTNSTCCYPSLAVTGQAITDPAGSLSRPQLLVAGSAVDQSSRYGDYFGAAVDPSDTTLVWVAGEYHTNSTGTCLFSNGQSSGSCWSTRIGSMRMPGTAISVSNTYLDILPGTGGLTVVTVRSLVGFTGTVTFSSAVSPSGPHGPTASFNPSSITLPSGGSANSTLTIGTTGQTPTGLYTFTITATSGQRSSSIVVQATVGPDFSMSSSQNTLTVQAGTSGALTVTLLGIDFSGSVSLTATVFPAGPSASLNPSTVSLTSGGSGSSSLSVSTTGSTAGDTYPVTVTGTSGSISHSITVTVYVISFGILASPTSQTFQAVFTGISTITLFSVNGFSGTVGLSVAVSPSGATASLAPSSVGLFPAGTGGSNLTISTTASTPPGTYSIIVTGTSGIQSHFKTITLSVLPSFFISANPTSVTFLTGGSGISTITITSVNGFASTVTLTALTTSNSLTASLNPTSVKPTAGGIANSTLTLTSSQPGGYSVTVKGASGSFSQSTYITVSVIGLVCLADVTTAAASSPCPGSPGAVFNGPRTTPATQLRVGVFIQGSASTIGYEIVLQADHTVLTPVGVDFTGNILGGSEIVLCLGGKGNSCAPNDTQDTIDVLGFNFGQSTTSPTTGLLFTAIYNITGTTKGTTVGFQTGCGYTSVQNGACVTIVDFSGFADPELIQPGSFANGTPTFATLSSNPISIQVQPGGSGSSTITGTANNGHPGSVTLTTAQSSGVTASLSSSTCDLTHKSTCSSSLSVSTSSSLAAGSYGVTMFGTYTFYNSTTKSTSTLAATLTIPIIVQDFSISASPSAITIVYGSSGSSTITLGSLNGFSGTVGLNATVTTVVALATLPSGCGGAAITQTAPTASVNPTSVTLSPAGTSSSTLTISTSGRPLFAGNYTVTVKGSSGMSSHSVTVSVQVTAFCLNVSPSSLTINPGSSGTVTVTVYSVNGFSGPVSLFISGGLPSGVTASFSPSTVQVAAGGAASSTLTLTASSTATASSGSISVQGNSSSLGYATGFTLTVT